LPNDKFWQAKVEEWNLDSPEEAKSSLCGNCAAFDQRKDTLDCIAQGIGSDAGEQDPTIEAGDLGYCRFLKFKCAARRTCDAWVTGGPLVDKPDVAEGSWQTPGLNLEPMGNKKQRDVQRQQGLRPTGPQRLMSELADMLHISVGQLTWLAQKIPGFPQVHGRHSSSQGNKGYYDLAEFKRWVVANKVRETIADWHKQDVEEEWSQKYKNSINCSHPKGFSQKAHCAGKKKHNESHEVMEMTCPDCGMCETHGDPTRDTIDENCWKGYHKEGNKELFGKTVPNCVKNEEVQEELCPECGGPMFSELMINEKQDACYYKVKSRYKVWPSAYASGALVQCRKKGAANWGNKNESVENNMDELSRILELGTGLSLEARAELAEEFDLIESIIEGLAEHNGVDSDMIWEDLESLSDDELYVFATTVPIMESEAWQKANNRDRTNGMSRKAVKAYRREHPGSKLQTAVTTKPSKLKKGSKASKRRKSYCSRSRGQMKMHNISCAKTPDKAICKARRRWNCE
jgi:hypothetical protein